KLQQRRDYDAHMNSETWRAKSLAVRRRNPICEGCGLNPSTQAHHETYENFGDEFLFQLRAVCDECHARLHAHMNDDTDDIDDETLARLMAESEDEEFE